MNRATNKQTKMRSGITFLLLALLAVSWTTTAQEEEPPYRILFLNARPAVSPWVLSMSSTCREEFGRLTGRRVEVFLENTRIAEDDSPKGTKALRTLFRERYAGRLDFIVLRSYSNSLPEILDAFPDVPLILPNQDIAQFDHTREPPSSFYTALIRLRPVKTARMILSICPGIRKLVVVSGLHPFGRLLEERARQEMGELFEGAAIEYWSGIPQPELQMRIAALPNDHVVLYLYMAQDRNGKAYIARDVVKELSAVSSVPVFGLANSYFDDGIVGGYVESSETVGRRAAEMLARLAEGRELEQFVQIEEYGEYQFDWLQMQRWGIPERRIPPQARLLNRPDSFFERHAWIGPSLGVSVALLGVLVLVLFWHLHFRRHAEKILAENEARYRQISELLSDYAYIFTMAEDGSLQREWSVGGFKRITGFSPQELDARGGWAHLIYPDDMPFAIARGQRLMEGEQSVDEFRIVRKNGDIRWIRDHGNPIWDEKAGRVVRIYGAVEDITRRREAEEALKAYSEQLEVMVHERTKELRDTQEQLIRKEKLATLGELAGSVAHELRHPLGVLSNASYFLNMSLSEADDSIKEYLAMIATEVRKSDKIISDLLAFSRQPPVPPLEKAKLRIPELVSEVLAEQPPPDGIEILLDMKPDLSLIFVDKQQLKQVLANLLQNAYQAMPDGGVVTVSSKQLSVSRAEGSHEGLRTDNCLLLTVQDTGVGISPEEMAKLFEPLFTTKPRGIGLGLAISKNFIEANGGRIEVTSTQGSGTTFTLFLPVADKERI